MYTRYRIVQLQLQWLFPGTVWMHRRVWTLIVFHRETLSNSSPTISFNRLQFSQLLQRCLCFRKQFLEVLVRRMALLLKVRVRRRGPRGNHIMMGEVEERADRLFFKPMILFPIQLITISPVLHHSFLHPNIHPLLHISLWILVPIPLIFPIIVRLPNPLLHPLR